MSFERAPREEHEATCAECGAQTTVPFKPTGNRPVLCRDCFRNSRPPGRDGPRGGGGGGMRGPGGPRRDGPREMHEVPCSRCGNVARVPFKPTPGRPVLCNDCFRQ